MTSTAQPAVGEMWGRPRFGYRANRMMLWIGTRFLPLGYALVGIAALYFVLFAPRARRASMAYLNRIHGHRGALRRWRQTYRHFMEFGLLLLDRALMLASPRHRFVMLGDGIPNLRRALDTNRGLLQLTAHFGNAEAAAPYMARIGFARPMHLVMYQKPGDATERFHTSQRRMLAGMNIISTTDPLAAGVKIIRALRENEVVAIRADRALDGRTVKAMLLGAPVRLPAGPFLAAALTGAPVLCVYTCRLGYRKYTCIISEPKSYGDDCPGTREERMARAAGDYAAFLEKILREHPYQWANFYDFWGASPNR
jgi:predicted LPLAT superfamily acyltransferase